MKEIYGISKTGNLDEAISKIENPDLLILMTTEENFKKHVNELEEKFKGVPSIGCTGISYAGCDAVEGGVTVIAMSGVKAVANVVEELSSVPVKYIKRLKSDLEVINAEHENTVCIDFACGYDGRLVTTLNMILGKRKISLIGGTVDKNMVSVNGKIYNDACAYLLVKNMGGKMRTYKENIYKPTGKRYIVTKSDPANNVVYEFGGKSAKDAYMSVINVKDKDLVTQTFQNPLGRLHGNEVDIFSISGVVDGSALKCYKQINNMDVITILELDDYRNIVKKTKEKILKDFNNSCCIFSINCIFRYLLFKDNNYLDDYLHIMNGLGTHVGFVGYGEHFLNEHINQTMSCVVFE